MTWALTEEHEHSSYDDWIKAAQIYILIHMYELQLDDIVLPSHTFAS